jgi:hypothetical protein
MAVAPGFVTVTSEAPLVDPTSWLPKSKLVGETLAAVPTPVRITLCGLSAPLSLTTRAARRGPVAVGWRWIEKVQLSPAARAAEQFEVNGKSPKLAPAIV